jgi:hypothetical protein
MRIAVPLARLVTPPAPVTIPNGVARNPAEMWWEGTVSPQGAVVMRNPNFACVDAQIDFRGTIRGGEYRGELPTGILVQTSGNGANCIVKFVWKKNEARVITKSIRGWSSPLSIRPTASA